MVLKQSNPRPQFLLKIALAFLVFFGFSTVAQTVRASFFDDILSLPNQLAEGSQIAIIEVFPSFFNQASLTSVLNDIQCFFGFNCTETTTNQEPTTNNENQISRNQNPITEDQKPQQPESQTTAQTNQQEAPTTQITQIINPTKEIQTIHTISNNTNTVVVDTDTKNQVNQLLRQLNSDRPNYSTGQTVSLPANLVSKTLNITSGDFNVDENGNVTANDITSNGNLTVQGNFAVSGSQTYSGSASFSATSTTPALLVEQTGSGNALQADNVTIKDSMIATDNGGTLQFQTANNYLDTNGNLVLEGDITAGKYNGLTINPTTKSLTVSNDATVSGTNTGDQTITLTGDITGSGNGSFATTIGNTKVTNAMLAGSIAASKLIGTDIATVGTITTGVWNGTTISPAKGGTGIANGTNNTITFTGNYTLGLTLSANTSLTLPSSGTLATTSDKLNAFASTSSSELSGTISDETGSGSLVFATSPTFTTQLTTPKVVGDTTGLYLNEDGGAGIFVKDGGNIGIGTTNPSSKLDVTGDIRISSGSGGQIIFADGSTMASSGLGSAAALSNTTDAIMTGDSDANNTGAVILKTGSNDRLHILNNGDVGIGTASPNTKLDVRGGINAGTNGTEFTLSSSGAVVAVTYNGLTLTSQATGYTISGGTASKTLTLDDNLTATTINSHLASTSNPHSVTQSQVGLGSVENTALSTWAGTGNITTVGTITAGTWNGTTISPTKGGTGIANGANNTITFTGNYTLGLTLSANTSLTLPTSGTLATTSDKLSAFASTSSSELSGTINDETGSGSLVFATSPTFTTQLTTPRVVGDTTGLYLNEDGGAGIFVKDGGNVGIGTTNPTNKLTVWNGGTLPSSITNVQGVFGETDGFANAGIALLSSLGNTGAIFFGTDTSTNLGQIAYNNSDNSMSFSTNVAEKVRIDSSGNVGIGTAVPNQKLHISGGAGSANLLIEADTDNSNEADQPSIILSQDGGIVLGTLGYVASENALSLYNQYSDSLQLGTNNNRQMMIINASGYVGIGTTNPSGPLHVKTPGGGFTATGGSVSYSGNYIVHTFTSSGTFTASSGGTVEYLVVAGGGCGGGGWQGGGGGGGGVRVGSLAITAGAKTVIVGAGGAGGGTPSANPGGNSVFDSITATGGGYGGGEPSGGGQNPGNGGSGGGGTHGATGGPTIIGTGIAGQGNNGGQGLTGGPYVGGGGGGAGAVGQNASSGKGGDGGAGVASAISGTTVYYGGGGGGTLRGGASGAGGIGGGGAGNTTGANGTANTGGGGGAGQGYNGVGVSGSGGSGIVIIRYLNPSIDSLIVTSTSDVIIGKLTGSGNRAVYSDANGILTNTSSDIRLKTNIENLSEELNILESLKKLRGIYYNWDTSVDAAKNLGAQREIGMVAQEVQAVMPELVGQNSSGYLSLDYPKMTAYLVEVAKVQQREIEDIGLNLNSQGTISASSTFDVALADNDGFVGIIEMVINRLGILINGGVARLKGIVADTVISREITSDKSTSKQMCVKDSVNNDICLTGDQLKDLISRAGSSVTINQTYQSPVVTVDNGTTTETGE